MSETGQINRSLTRVLDERHYLEGPRWHDGRLWVSDLYAYEVLALSPDGEVEVMASVPGQPSGLGWLPDGRLLVVSMKDRKLLRREHSGELVVHADLSSHTDFAINDMVVDGEGNAYLGGFGFDVMNYAPIQRSGIYHVSPDGNVTPYGSELACPNGHAISPDGSTLVVAESFGARLTAFDIGAGGKLSNQRVWADFGAPETLDLVEYVGTGAVTPDGICFDAEGAVWMADALSNRLLRVLEGGEIVDEIRHDKLIVAAALGGEDRRTLYMCAAPSFAEAERKVVREAEIVTTRVDVPGAGWP